MTVTGHGVPAVRHLAPHRIGDEFVLRLAGPVEIAAGVAAMNPEHFLQEKDVGRQPVQPLAQLVDHHSAVELGKALVDVIGGNGESHGGKTFRGPSNGSDILIAASPDPVVVCHGWISDPLAPSPRYGVR